MSGVGPPGFMALALAEAERAGERGEVPVGAVVVEAGAGAVLASAGNRVEELRDPTAHAEMLALRAAAARQGAPRLTDCDLYVTLEPCPMCAAAISFARVRRLYFGASDPKGGGVETRTAHLLAADLPSPARGLRRDRRGAVGGAAEAILRGASLSYRGRHALPWRVLHSLINRQ